MSINILGAKMSLSGFFKNTPKIVHLISIIFIGWATYGYMIAKFIQACPIDAPVFKNTLIVWLNWICPVIGIILQFIHKNESNPSATDPPIE